MVDYNEVLCMCVTQDMEELQDLRDEREATLSAYNAAQQAQEAAATKIMVGPRFYSCSLSQVWPADVTVTTHKSDQQM